MAKKNLHTTEQINAFTAELQKQTDRGAALIAAAVLEDLLAIVIQRRLIELSNKRREALFGRMAPLSTFAAKIEIGFALGLYAEQGRSQLDLVRDVRNKFAHRFDPLTFQHPDIVAVMKQHTRPSLLKLSNLRQTFIATFTVMAIVLYGQAAFDDLRIKAIGDTHPDEFGDLYRVLLSVRQQLLKERQPSPPPQGQVEPKPK